MPHILSPIISKKLPGLWGEGRPYESATIYDIHNKAPNSPSVQYESHLLKPHSLPHMDAPGHIIPGGHTIDWFFKENQFDRFYGKALVIRLKGNTTAPHVVTLEELKSNVHRVTNKHTPPNRLLLTLDNYPSDENGLHSQNHPLVLSEAAANWLINENPKFCVYGTSWKSTDFQPGSKERPIHKILFSKNVGIFECLHMKDVPEGEYYWFAVPLPLENASESPVCPILLTDAEFKAMST